MKDLVKKVAEFREKFALTNEQEELLKQELNALDSEYPLIQKYEKHWESSRESSKAFQLVSAWYKADEAKYPLSTDTMFHELCDARIYNQGLDKESNAKRFSEIFNSNFTDNKEFRDFISKLEKSLDPYLDTLEETGKLIYEKQFHAIENLQKKGMKLHSKEDVERAARSAEKFEKRKRRNKR